MNTLVVTSTQSIDLPGPPDVLDALGRTDMLPSLLRDYFSVAERFTCGLARLRWSPSGPRFTFLWPPVVLLGMGPPTCEANASRCAISLDVVGGLLVDPGSTPQLAIALTRRADDLEASVELRDYAPRGVRWGAVRWLYLQSQARVHAQVGLIYLRQLRRSWPAYSTA